MDLVFNKYTIIGFIKEAFNKNEVDSSEVLDTVMGVNKIKNNSRLLNTNAEPRINLRKKTKRFGGGTIDLDEFGTRSGQHPIGDQQYISETSN